MLEEKNGRKIESIKFNKNSVSIYFENGESLKISEATFTHFYLYKDKVLSDEEYKSIEDHQALNSSKQYAINLLSKGMYTEKEILNRLINKKKLTSSDAKKIIDYLLEHNFLNDNKYFEEYVDSLNRKKYGKNKIERKCLEEGFSKSLVDNMIFDEENEKEKAIYQLNKYVEGKNKNYNQLKENAYTFLINQGFDFDICSNVIKIIDDIYDFSKEKILLEKELVKYLRSHDVNLKDYNDYQKVLITFTRKGYSYEDVKNVIKGVTENEIC